MIPFAHVCLIDTDLIDPYVSCMSEPIVLAGIGVVLWQLFKEEEKIFANSEITSLNDQIVGRILRSPRVRKRSIRGCVVEVECLKAQFEAQADRMLCWRCLALEYVEKPYLALRCVQCPVSVFCWSGGHESESRTRSRSCYRWGRSPEGRIK